MHAQKLAKQLVFSLYIYHFKADMWIYAVEFVYTFVYMHVDILKTNSWHPCTGIYYTIGQPVLCTECLGGTVKGAITLKPPVIFRITQRWY